MRKLMIILLVIVMLFAGFMTYKTIAAKKEAAEAQAALEEMQNAAAEQADAAAQTAETPKIELDFDKLYALHKPEDVIMKVNGEDVTWGDYFYCLYAQGTKVMSSMAQVAMYYGMSPAWDDPMDETGTETVADLAVSNSVEMYKQQKAIEKLAKDNDLVLSEEEEAQLKEESDEYLNSAAGENATEEEINAALSKMYITHERFDEINRIGALYEKAFAEKYGENCEKVSDSDAVKYLEDNNYLSATHILFMTVDISTGESLGDDVKAEKKAKAEEVAKQLKAIEDKDELVKTFGELKTEYCEDTGKEAYPNGYLFTAGTMVEPFETAVQSLKDYEVSDVVETDYGYHVIMRLPFDPDMETTNGETGRSLFAKEDFAKQMQEMMDAATVEPVNDYTAPKLSEFVK